MDEKPLDLAKVERVARAIASAESPGREPDEVWPPGGGPNSKPRWLFHVKAAKAAIREMEKPA